MIGNQAKDTFGHKVTTGGMAYSGGIVPVDTVDIVGCYNYWQEQRPIIYPTPIAYNFCNHTVEDKGLKALSILKVLITKKLAKIETIEQFIDIMDELVKIL